MNTVITNIQKVISWYANIPADFNDIDLLLNSRRVLATRLYELAVIMAQAIKEKNSTEHERKSFEYRRKCELMAAAEKPVISHIEAIVFNESSTYRDVESAAEAEFKAMQLIYGAAETVVYTMQQHIANLRGEKSREVGGGGSPG